MKSYTDKKLADFQKQYQSKLAEKGLATVTAELNRLRSSEKIQERVKAAVGYAELAKLQADLKEYKSAAYNFHFAAHSFRTCGNTNKAAKLYEKSFDVGLIEVHKKLERQSSIQEAIQLQKFNQRSIGRSAKLYSESGCPQESILAYLKREDGRSLLLSMEGNKFALTGYQLWKIFLGYNLNLKYLLWIFLMVLIGLSLLPTKAAMVLVSLASIAALTTIFRLLNA